VSGVSPNMAGLIDAHQRSKLDSLLALIEITRPATCLGAGLLALLGVRITMLHSSSAVGGFWDTTRTLGFVVGWFLMAQSVFAVNDVFDAPIDAISHPARAIPSGRVRRGDAWMFGAGLCGLGSVVLTLVSPPLGIVALCYAVMSWLYSARIKRWNGLVANSTVAGLIAFVPLSVAAAGLNAERLWWLPFPIFLGVLAREILNDIEDEDGDRAAGRPTLPVMLGCGWAYRASTACWLGFALTTYLPLAVEPYLRTPAYIILASILNVIVLAVAVVLLRQPANLLVRLQLITKQILFAYVAMILGLLLLSP
jgi:4-hydroxybenzoate polyprenyltransferase